MSRSTVTARSSVPQPMKAKGVFIGPAYNRCVVAPPFRPLPRNRPRRVHLYPENG